MLIGLYEEFHTLSDIVKDESISNCCVSEISYISGFKKDNSTGFGHVFFNNEYNSLCGLVNYDLLRGHLYTRGKRNKEMLQFIYRYRFTDENTGKTKESPYVKYFGLVSEDNGSLKLSTHTPEVYINLIGQTILKEYATMNINFIRMKILRHVPDDLSQGKLNFFSNYTECHNELKRLIKDNDIIGKDNIESCERFMKYYTKVYNIQEVTIEDYIKAYDLIVDLCNMIEKIKNFSKDWKISKERVRENIEIYKSICITFENNISDMLEDYGLQVCMYDENNGLVNSADIKYHKMDNMIIIPIYYLVKGKIRHISFKIDEIESSKINVWVYMNDITVN